MTKLTTKRTPPTPTCLSSTTPTTRSSAWDETDIRKDPETETIEIDPEEAAVPPTSPTHDRPARSTQFWAEPADNDPDDQVIDA